MEIDTDLEPVILRVSGRIFETTRRTFKNIPTLANMVQGCLGDGSINEVITVNRSARVFKHILSYAQDSLYPFPVEYIYELDWMGMAYDKTKLYDPHKETITMLVELNKTMKKDLELLASRTEYIESGVYNIGNATKYKRFVCIKKDCTNTCQWNRLLCIDCQSLCYLNTCQEKKQNSMNYCAMHYMEGTYCNQTYCWRKRFTGSKLCFVHMKW